MNISRKFYVLIASHLVSPERLETLGLAIESLNLQTVKPDKIYISCYIEGNLILNFDNTEIFYSETKKSQFEHYQFLFENVKFNDYDVIMFCDDDDLYRPKRIEKIKDYFEKNPYKNMVKTRIFSFGNPYSRCVSQTIISPREYQVNEYVCFSPIYRFAMICFEKAKEHYDIKNGAFDTCFATVLGKYEYETIEDLDALYMYRKDALKRYYDTKLKST